MVHDMLEHRLTDTGKLHEEAMAFGRLTALRLVSGVRDRYGETDEGNLGAEFAGIWNRSDEENRCLEMVRAPKTAPITSYGVEQSLRAIMKKCMKTLHIELEQGYGEDDIPEIPKGSGACFLSWLRIGYRDAIRRYGEQDHGCWDVGNYAFRWAKENSLRIQCLGEGEDIHPDAVLRLCFDTERMEMKDRLYMPNETYDQHPAWLRSKIWIWRNT